MRCDLLIHGTIHTMEPDQPKANWLAVRDGKILSISEREPMGLEADNTIELEDESVLPGLIDSHAHGTDTGIYLRSVKLEGCRNIKEVLETVDDFCKNCPNDLVMGMDLNDDYLEEHRLPYMWELDEVSHGKAIMLNHTSLHGSTCNSAFWNELDIDRENTAVRKLDGRYTGIIEDGKPYFTAYNHMLDSISKEQWMEFRRAISDFYFSYGITTLHSLDGSANLPGMRDVTAYLDHLDEVPLHTVPFVEDFDVTLAHSYGLKQCGGCLLLDGAVMQYSAALFDPYTTRPESRGLLFHSDAEVYQFVKDAHNFGMQSTMHALGPCAIDQLLYIIRRVLMEAGEDNTKVRHRIEHFSLPTMDQIHMAVENQIICSMQPVFSLVWPPVTPEPGKEKYYKKEVSQYSNAVGLVVREGGIVCAGSDCPCLNPDPIPVIHDMVNTDREVGHLDLDNALKLYTINAAYAGHEEDIRGSLKEGKVADLIILSSDPYQYPQRIKDMKINKTISGGKIVFSREA